MTDFRPDCTINLHVELRGKPAKVSWACSIAIGKHGTVVMARRFLGIVSRDEAELAALLFGLAQAQRLQQEKVEIAATFSLDGRLADDGGARRLPPELRPRRDEAARIWSSFRLAKEGRVAPERALALREAAVGAFARKRR